MTFTDRVDRLNQEISDLIRASEEVRNQIDVLEEKDAALGSKIAEKARQLKTIQINEGQ
ncbi:MAG TPA: hypothetical protein VFM18_21915 [Methanosarcina sp.]|nr:hypothetical protein [Methanosarcina sp.]